MEKKYICLARIGVDIGGNRLERTVQTLDYVFADLGVYPHTHTLPPRKGLIAAMKTA